MSIQDFCLFLDWGCLCVLLFLRCEFKILDINPLPDFKNFPLFCGLFFHSFDGVLSHTKFFNFDEVSLIFVACAFDVLFKYHCQI